MKKIITLEKQFEILRSVQMIGVMAKMINVEFQQHLIDNKFRNPVLNNHAKRIKESADSIVSGLAASGFQISDFDKFNYQYVLNLYEIFEVFTQMSTEQIQEYTDGLKELSK